MLQKICQCVVYFSSSDTTKASASSSGNKTETTATAAAGAEPAIDDDRSEEEEEDGAVLFAKACAMSAYYKTNSKVAIVCLWSLSPFEGKRASLFSLSSNPTTLNVITLTIVIGYHRHSPSPSSFINKIINNVYIPIYIVVVVTGVGGGRSHGSQAQDVGK